MPLAILIKGGRHIVVSFAISLRRGKRGEPRAGRGGDANGFIMMKVRSRSGMFAAREEEGGGQESDARGRIPIDTTKMALSGEFRPPAGESRRAAPAKHSF